MKGGYFEVDLQAITWYNLTKESFGMMNVIVILNNL